MRCSVYLFHTLFFKIELTFNEDSTLLLFLFIFVYIQIAFPLGPAITVLPSPSCCGIWGFNFKECEKRFTCTPFIIYYLIRTISASVCSSYLLQIINSRQDHNFKIHMGKLIRASLQLRASVDVKLRSTSRVFAPSIFYEST